MIELKNQKNLGGNKMNYRNKQLPVLKIVSYQFRKNNLWNVVVI